MASWIPLPVELELLHRLVPAALEEDLLDSHVRREWLQQADEVAYGWQCWPAAVAPLVDVIASLGVDEWPALGISWEEGPCPPPPEPALAEPESWVLSARQQLALLSSVLGAVVIAEWSDPAEVVRLL